MQKLVYLLTVSLCTFSFSACKQHDEGATQLGGIDSLQTELSKLEKMFAEIKPNEVATISSTIDADIDSAYTLCEKTNVKLTEEEGTFFGRYQALKSSLKKFDSRHKTIEEQLALTKQQLANLKAFSENEKVDKVALAKYTTDETVALEKLTAAVEQMHGSAVYVRESYSEFRPQLLTKLTELSKRKK